MMTASKTRVLKGVRLLLESGSDRGESTVSVSYFAGDRARQRREIKRRDVADLVDRDVAPQRRVVLDEMQDLGEAADAGRGERLDRSRRNRIDACAIRPQCSGEIADVRLEARLGEAHQVV